MELVRIAWFLSGEEAAAQDLLQHALMKTYLAWPRVRRDGAVAYTRRVMVNRRTDLWRARRREVVTSPDAMPTTPVPSPADRHAERDRLIRALATLPPRQRRIVALRHLAGLSEAEVAEDLGVSLGTVKAAASRGLHRLREVLLEAEDERSRT